LMRPCARGPGASAIGGAGVGDGERDLSSVAECMLKYDRWRLRSGGYIVILRYAIVVASSMHI
jgi:hypothetical protein